MERQPLLDRMFNRKQKEKGEVAIRLNSCVQDSQVRKNQFRRFDVSNLQNKPIRLCL